MGEEVVCGAHGTTPITFCCRHAAAGVACGFWIAPPDPDQARPDATCDLCDERLRAGEELGKTNIKLICTHCWDEVRARNEHPPRFARGQRARLTGAEEKALFDHAWREMGTNTARARKRWPIGFGIDTPRRWSLDRGACLMTFSDDSGPRVLADVRIVGTFSLKSATFEWGWKTYGGEPIAAGIGDLRAFGEVRGIDKLQQASWECDEAEPRVMAGLAGYLLGSDAGYLAPLRDDLHAFMLLRNLRAPS